MKGLRLAWIRKGLIFAVALLLAGAGGYALRARPAAAPSPAVSASRVPGPPADDPVLAVLNRWAEAVETRDFKALDRLYAPDALVFVSGRATQGWPVFRDRHLRPGLEPLSGIQFVCYGLGGGRDDRLAWVAFRFRLTGSRKGVELDGQGLATAVLRHDAEGWRIIHMHTSSPLPTVITPPSSEQPGTVDPAMPHGDEV